MLACMLLIALLKICTSQEVCDDNHFSCGMRKFYCNDLLNKDWMHKNCRLTCGICLPPVTTTTPSPSTTKAPPGNCGFKKVQTGRIINGVDARKGDWPWQVLLKYEGEPDCGGSIINPFWVLTAAHCVRKNGYRIGSLSVVAGESNLAVTSGTEISFGVSKIINHEKYDFWTLDYDVALLKLDRPIIFNNYMTPVCLPEQNTSAAMGTNCYMTGWGTTNRNDSFHEKLQQAMLPVVDAVTCKKLNDNPYFTVSDRMLCAGSTSSRTSGCKGDSGGPLVCQASNGRWYLQGSVSWGSARCNSSEAYTVFAKTSYFRGWIDKQIAMH